ncbi:hypothetical protein ACFXKW_09590 [Streptomyces sp. NPDC059193]|uniref:hypothetical protein n=1 Tax=Streptomyces sp. NPDC059193 TaxID=3346763 RepID=UPI0036822C70
MSFLTGAGVFGVAAILTVVLWFGTKDNEGGKAGPLPWWACVLLPPLAGASFVAAGFPFDTISSLVNDIIGLVGKAFPKLTMPALAGILVALAFFKKLSRRGFAMLFLVLFFVASGAGGPWAELANRIAAIAQSVGS